MFGSRWIDADLVARKWATRVMVLALAVGLMVVGYVAEAEAAPGDLDRSFGSFGKVTTDFSTSFDSGSAVAVQDDGKVVVAGATLDPAVGSNGALARYNTDGTLDSSFGTGGKVTTDVPGASNAVAIRADGRIVVAGSTSDGAGFSDFAVARYKTDGSPDDTFGGDGKVTTSLGSGGTDSANGVAVQGNKTLVIGSSYQGNPASGGTGLDFAAVRLTAGGAPDPTFGGGDGKVTTDFFGGSPDQARSVAVQSDGKIVLAGYTCECSSPGQQDDFALVRYDSAGNPDPSFDTDGKVTTDFSGNSYDQANSVALQEDGRIIATGSTAADTSSPQDFALARYNPNGSLNTSFGAAGRVTTDFGGGDRAFGVVIQDDGRILAAGDSDGDFALARYNTDGSPDDPFGDGGKVKTDFAGSVDIALGVALQTDGKAVAAGFAYTDASSADAAFALARYFTGNDRTPPRVSAPAQSLTSPSSLGASSVPVKISWSATDSEGEVASYGLQLSINGGPYTNVALPSPTATTKTRSLVPGRNYRFRVRATDDNGNTSFFEYGPRFTVDAQQETSANITYTPSASWTQQALTNAYGGGVKYATVAGSEAEFAFTGTSVGWVAPKGPNRGEAEVYLDGNKVATVDLTTAALRARQVVFAANGLSAGTSHTLEVRVVGASAPRRVDVDAFVVLR